MRMQWLIDNRPEFRESLQKYHYFLRDSFKVPFPTTAGPMMHLGDVAAEISRRLSQAPGERERDAIRSRGDRRRRHRPRCGDVRGPAELSTIVLGSAGERSAALDIGIARGSLGKRRDMPMRRGLTRSWYRADG